MPLRPSASLAAPMALLLALALGLAPPAACAADAADRAIDAASATEAAFGELLSLPQGLPDDSNFQVQSPEVPATNQAELQERLQALVDAGADVNDYRHYGTLLHHAIRANLQDTALWLLAHGADPRLEVQVDEGEGKAATRRGDGNDALQLAILYGRWRVVDALMRRPALRPATDLDRAFRWSAAIDRHLAGDSPVQAWAQLRKRGLPLPEGPWAECLLAQAENAAFLPMVIALPVRQSRLASALPGPKPTGRGAVVAAGCGPAGPHWQATAAPGAAWSTLSVAELQAADARRVQPLMPALVPSLRDLRDVQAMAATSLRRPAGDRDFVRAMVTQALDPGVPPDVRVAVLRLLPDAALGTALGDDLPLRLWAERMSGGAEADALWALRVVADASFSRSPTVLLQGLEDAVRDAERAAKEPPKDGRAPAPRAPTPAVWHLAVSRLPDRLSDPVEINLLRAVPEAEWPALAARHLVPSSLHVNDIRRSSTGAQWRARWAVLGPMLTPAQRVEVLQDALAPWTRECYGNDASTSPAAVETLRVFQAAGVTLPAPAVMPPSCAARLDDAARRAVLATKLVVPAPPVAAPVAARASGPAAAAKSAGKRFSQDPLRCDAAHPPAPVVSAMLRGAFLADAEAGSRGEDRGEPTPEVIQAIDDPAGGAACAWLVTGGHVVSRVFIDQESFYDGYQRLTPCADGTLHAEVWRVVDGRLVASDAGEGAQEGLARVRDVATGRRLVVSLPYGGGTCDGGGHVDVMGWTGGPGAPLLKSLAADDPSRMAFELECGLADPGPCVGLPSHDVENPPPQVGDPDARPTAGDAFSVDQFVALHAAPLRERYLGAFLAMDKAALQAIEAGGLWPAWRIDALAALNASALPVAEKRRRTAWMFRDAAGMKATFSTQYGRIDAVNALVAWLPREDWRPLLAALSHDTQALQDLEKAAGERGDAKLACQFVRAQKRACGAAPAASAP